MNFHHLLLPVAGRGAPPIQFLTELVEWGKTAPAEIFAPNDEPGDVMGKLRGILGPWQSEMQRRCAMLELLRCLAGFESSWHWNEGVDTTNRTSMAHVEGQETGIFQVSFDSLGLEHQHHTLKALLDRHGVTGPQSFIGRMKVDHQFAMEYAARLLRINYRWDGPIRDGHIDSSLSRAAMDEFEGLISA